MSRFILYRTQEEHSADCERHPFGEIPRRTFIDTNVINCLVKNASHIFEMEKVKSTTDSTSTEDIESLMHIFKLSSRANWDIITSHKAVEELGKTTNTSLREELVDYGIGFVGSNHPDDTFDIVYANDLARRLRYSQFLAVLSDINDRDLISHAIAFECDGFCTCDRRTIHSKRASLRALPLRVLTPAEWWAHIKPWAGLWC